MKTKVLNGVLIAVVVVVVSIIALDIQYKTNHYSIPAVVYGVDCDGYTLFETKDGNLWAYKLADPFYLNKGTEVRLNMYNMSPDGHSVKDNIVLSVEYNGVEMREIDKEAFNE